MATVDKVNVEVEVRLQKLEAQMKQAEAIVAKSTARIDKRTRDAGFGFGIGAQRAVRGFLATQLASGGLRVGEALIQGLAGNTEKVVEALERLPLGFGAAVTAIKDFANAVKATITGTDKLEKDLEKIIKRGDQMSSMKGAVRDAMMPSANEIKSLETQARIAELQNQGESIEAAKLEAQFRRDQARRQLELEAAERKRIVSESLKFDPQSRLQEEFERARITGEVPGSLDMLRDNIDFLRSKGMPSITPRELQEMERILRELRMERDSIENERNRLLGFGQFAGTGGEIQSNLQSGLLAIDRLFQATVQKALKGAPSMSEFQTPLGQFRAVGMTGEEPATEKGQDEIVSVLQEISNKMEGGFIAFA